jgi:hypothetical protein
VREQPRVHSHGQTPEGEELRVSDFLARSQFQRLRLYDQIHRMIGAEHQMTTELPTTPPLEIGISLNRGGRAFSEQER